jgi:hypothetical protein
MKAAFNLILMVLLLNLSSCNKNDNCDNPVDCLPPKTQTGAGTFGCLINGEVFEPGGSQLSGPTKQAYYKFHDGYFYFGLKGTNKNTNQLIAIFGNKIFLKENETYSLEKEGEISFNANYILNGGLFIYKTSEIHKGEINFSKFDDVNGIASGTFWFDAISEEGEVVEIREGRFDMKYN